MDILLIRPPGALFQAIGVAQEINGMGSAITGFAVMFYSAINLNLHWNFGSITFLIIAIICNTLIYYDVLMLLSIVSFWVINIRRAMMPIAWLYDFTRYPISIFLSLIKGFLTFVIPYTVGTFYPTIFLLRPNTQVHIIWILPVMTIAFSSLVYSMWKIALNHYSSASG